jgi:CheY-like chemotaxis protein
MSRVLVVDDEDDIRDLIAFVLRRQGYDVTSIASPLVALARATAEPFDLAVLDWSMPQMNGGELCARLRELPEMRDAPILIVTAHADPATRAQAERAGATQFVTKPFSLKHLGEVVADLLAVSSPSPDPLPR